ncbi:aminotransferase class I/II-fold pyridoxal phosphate-dependent enzyme [Fructilactobacillus sp. Tb1]|uniref:aminotransferase class I/II-fold pyridoxal phosphate-dependent enzyme n=1 Tax=Fructilactobacillus sp. Tb1 TaxID=3422304 RepID=UPI003D289583
MPNTSPKLHDTYNHDLNNITKSLIRKYAEAFAKIPDLVNLNLGEPGFNTPEHVKDAAVQSIVDNQTHYSPELGWLETREAVSRFLKRSTTIDYDPLTEIIIAHGAQEGLSSSFIATIDKGDQVLVPLPAYPAYMSIIELAKGEVIPIDTKADNLKLTPKTLEKYLTKYPKAKEIILNYPTNPSGVVYTRDEMKALADVLQKHGILVIADEVYSELTFDIPHTSIAEFIPDQTVIINGLSKSHAMTGYRFGYIAGPAELIQKINMVHGTFLTSAPNVAQLAAIAALDHGADDPKVMAKEYQKRRDIMVKTLTDLGFELSIPEGAFYILAKIPSQFNETSEEFTMRLANEVHVGVTPGNAFGTSGKGYVRLSFAADPAKIKEAMSRLTTFVNAN